MFHTNFVFLMLRRMFVSCFFKCVFQVVVFLCADRCEDQRFELDILIENNAAAICVLEGILQVLRKLDYA